MKRLVASGLLFLAVMGLLVLADWWYEPQAVQEMEPIDEKTGIFPSFGGFDDAVKWTFSDRLTSIAFYQRSGEQTQDLVELTAANFPTAPASYALHLDEVYAFIEFSMGTAVTSQLIADRLKIEGQGVVQVTSERHNNLRFKITISNIGDEVKLQFDDMYPITLFRAEPLQFEVRPQQEEVAYIQIASREYGSRVWLSESTEQLELVFDEEIDWGQLSTPLPDYVQVIDDQRLAVRLDPSKETTIQLPTLYAKSGNYLDQGVGYLTIVRVPNHQPLVDDLNWSERDALYEMRIFSPDNKRYIGVLSLGPTMGDGDGYSYSFVLEEPGREPNVLEKAFYSTVSRQGGVPLMWISNHEIMYASYFGIYTRHMQEQQRESVYEMNDDGQGFVNYAVYDTYKDKLYAIVFPPDQREEEFIAERWIYTALQQKKAPEVERLFTRSIRSGKYSILNLTITPRKDGVIWTKVTNGKVTSVYEKNNGEIWFADGVVLAAYEDGVVLAPVTAYSPEWTLRLTASYLFWPIGSQEPEPLATPPGMVFMNNQRLIAVATPLAGKDFTYFQYNHSQKRWDQMSEADRIPLLNAEQSEMVTQWGLEQSLLEP